MNILLIAAGLLGMFGNPVSDSVDDHDLSFVKISEPNNPADENGYGTVAYAYRITREQINNELYARFLNAVDAAGLNGKALYRSEMTCSSEGGIMLNLAAPAGRKYAVKTGYGNRPVVFVNWRDAARFANWIRNGGRKGSSTEIGTYNLRESEKPGRTRGGNYWIPCENEIYKAGFYLPLGAGGDDGDRLYTRIVAGTDNRGGGGAVSVPVAQGFIYELVDPAVEPPSVRTAAVIFAGRADPEAENGRVGFRLAAALTDEIQDDREAEGDSYAGAPDPIAASALPAFLGGSGAGGGNSRQPVPEPPPAS